MAIAKNMRSTQPLPFGFNPKVEARNGRLRRLMRKGTIKPMSKAEARRLCDEAVKEGKR